ncbi:MAG: hypothetical protein WAX85_03360 [Minisyncoccia bacterium]
MKKTIVFIVAVSLGLNGCSREITSKFQVSGWNLGDPVHKNVQFVINGDSVGPVVKFGQSSGVYEVEIVVGQSSYYNSGTTPTNDVQSTNVALGVQDVDTHIIFMVVQGCYLTKYQVTNFIYERKGGLDNLYCR